MREKAKLEILSDDRKGEAKQAQREREGGVKRQLLVYEGGSMVG